METENIDLLVRRVTYLLNSKGLSDVSIRFQTDSGNDNGIIAKILNAKICAVKDGVPQEFDVIIKCAPNNEAFRRTMLVRNMFLRETLYYTKIVPAYDYLQDQLLHLLKESRCLLPKFYVASDNFKQEIVILEDLTKKGFRNMSLQTLDYEHAVIIFLNIAKLHALSFIYEDRYPQRFRELADQCIDILKLPNEEYDETCMSQHGELTNRQFIDAITDLSLRRRCQAAAETNALTKYKELMSVGKIMAILHGDNWHNNHMFKYKNGKPVEAIPIDFQWSRYGSIGHDVMYLFAFSITGELRRNHYYKLVNEYYSGLDSFLKLCGYDANKFCSYKQLELELKSQAMISIVAFMIGAPFFQHPGFTLPKLISSPEVYTVSEEYKQSVNDMVTDWAKFGFI